MVFVAASYWSCGGNPEQRNARSDLPARCSGADSLTCTATVEDESGVLLHLTLDDRCDGQPELTSSATREDGTTIVVTETVDGGRECAESRYDGDGKLIRFVVDIGCDGSPARMCEETTRDADGLGHVLMRDADCDGEFEWCSRGTYDDETLEALPRVRVAYPCAGQPRIRTVDLRATYQPA